MGTRLYVGNIPYGTTDADLRTLFGQNGRQVTDVKIITDRETGQSRGFAFVEMSNPDEAKTAVTELNGSSVGGRAIVVNEARERAQGGGPGRGFGGGGGGGGRNMGGGPGGGPRNFGGPGGGPRNFGGPGGRSGFGGGPPGGGRGGPGGFGGGAGGRGAPLVEKDAGRRRNRDRDREKARRNSNDDDY